MLKGGSSYASALLSLWLMYNQDPETAYNSWEAERTEASCGPVLMLQRKKLQVDVHSLQILILQHVPVSVILNTSVIWRFPAIKLDLGRYFVHCFAWKKGLRRKQMLISVSLYLRYSFTSRHDFVLLIKLSKDHTGVYYALLWSVWY